MTDKELRKLRRDDLLQILISQQRQIDELTQARERDEAALAKRDIAIQEAGSVAEAALRLNGVFEAAQAAADEYEQQMRKRADELAAEAEKRGEDAKRLADELVKNARGEAERMLSQARREAEALTRQAAAGPQETPGAAENAQSEDADDGKRRRGFLWRNRKQ